MDAPNEDPEITEAEYDDTAPEEEVPVFRIKFQKNDLPFFRPKLNEREVFIVKKPGKIDIFVPDLKLANIIAANLNEIKAKWKPGTWCTNPELTAISVLGKTSRKKIVNNIIPIIEKIIRDFYGIEKITKDLHGDEKR